MGDQTVLVTGATGLLGRQVLRAFARRDWTAKGSGYSRADGASILKIDLASSEEVEKALDAVKYVRTWTLSPTSFWVLELTCSAGLEWWFIVRDQQVAFSMLFCHLIYSSPNSHFSGCTGAANRFPDKVDKDPEGTRKLNVEASRDLAKLCAERNTLLIYISTDYVFSGKPGEAPYEADAPTGPTNLYGQTKLDGEHAVLEAYKAAGKENLGVILRVPVLYGDADLPSESAVNVLMDVLWKAQQGEKVTMEHWALRYPTNTEDVGRVCHGKSSYWGYYNLLRRSQS